MLRSIKRFFIEHIQPEAAHADPEHAVRLATAALLIETLHADHAASDDERRAVEAAVGELFMLPDEETATLIRLAEQEVREATSLYQFTSLVDKHFALPQKIRIIELLWTVVFSDEVKDKHEEHLVRRIADLLHVPHGEFVRTRHVIESSARQATLAPDD